VINFEEESAPIDPIFIPDTDQSNQPTAPKESQEEDSLLVPLRETAWPKYVFVVDLAKAIDLLTKAYRRPFNVFDRVAYLGQVPTGKEGKHTSLILYARRALKPGGILYVPQELSDNPALVDLEPVDSLFEGFEAFQRGG
jgi:hypothetical protein